VFDPRVTRFQRSFLVVVVVSAACCCWTHCWITSRCRRRQVMGCWLACLFDERNSTTFTFTVLLIGGLYCIVLYCNKATEMQSYYRLCRKSRNEATVSNRVNYCLVCLFVFLFACLVVCLLACLLRLLVLFHAVCLPFCLFACFPGQ
jgi:hypothetical protein